MALFVSNDIFTEVTFGTLIFVATRDDDCSTLLHLSGTDKTKDPKSTPDGWAIKGSIRKDLRFMNQYHVTRRPMLGP